MIDIDALKAKLAEYDDALPRCPQKIERRRNHAPDYMTPTHAEYHDWDVTTHDPCCRPAGHDGECRNGRYILGWPGFVTLSALVAEVERLRAHRESCVENLLKGYETGKAEERNAVLSERKRADSLALAYREQQGENDVLRAKLEATERERDHFREAWAAAQARLDCGEDAVEAVREERDAVVAMLLDEARAAGTYPAEWVLNAVARDIERGEHRCEGER